MRKVSGRVLVVHATPGTRAQLVELLSADGLRVEAATTTFRGMAAYVEEPVEVVVLGLAGLAERDLEFVRALKRQEGAPRIVVSFPAPRRELATLALAAGADAYLLEPFYPGEVTAVVAGQRAEDARDETGELVQLAGEVAHAINNPLQILTLILHKDKVTKRELMSGIPPELERVQEVVDRLREFGEVLPVETRALDVVPLAEAVAAEHKLSFERDVEIPKAQADATACGAALQALIKTLRAHAPEAPLDATLRHRGEEVVFAVRVRATALGETPPAKLVDAVFVVGGDRKVRPGLARVRERLGAQGARLTYEQDGDRVVFAARFAAA